jgi:hypothetical protein
MPEALTRRWQGRWLVSIRVVCQSWTALVTTSWLFVTFGDAGGKLAEAPGSWSGIEG